MATRREHAPVHGVLPGHDSTEDRTKENPDWKNAPGRFISLESNAYEVFNIMPIVGRLQEDENAKALGTGYMQFENEPLHMAGLCKPTPTGISFLAVVSEEAGRGYFREFIQQLKAHYRSIEFLVDLNPVVSSALFRYGFVRIQKMDSDGSKIRGWLWTR